MLCHHHIFYGPHCSTCLNVDLQLDVKGCRDVYASFDKYVEVERLEGDNKYHAEQYGLQVNSIVIPSHGYWSVPFNSN